MATLKIIANKNCKLFIDQDLICEIEAQKLYKHELEVGVYLVDVAPLCEDGLGNSISFDLDVETANQQILKRINFEFDEPSSPTHSTSYINNPDVIFYNGVAMVSANGKYGYIDQSQKWIFEPQFDEAEHMKNGYAIVARNFDQGKKYTFVNPKGELCVGMWFDEIVSRKEDFVIIRRYHELFKINTQQMSIIESYFLEGSIIKGSPIPVSKEVNGRKKYIYVDDNLNITLDMEFDYASNFSNSGYAEVEKYGIRRFINKEGDICILNTLEEIEANNKLFMLLPIHNERGGNYEWCGLLETPDNDDLFLKNVYRLAIRKDGKWGYSCVRRESYGNKLTVMFEPNFDEFLSDSRYGYVIAKDNNYLCVVNLIGAQYARGDKKGQYVYGKVGDVLYRYQCDEMYPINKRSYEWIDYGGYGGNEVKRTFQNIIVKVNGKYGIINRNSTFIQKCIYDDIYTQYWNESKEKVFEDSPFIVERDGKKGLLTFDCKIALNCQFSEIYGIGKFWCIKRSGSDKYVLYELSSNLFFNFEFDDIIYGNYQVHVRYDSCGTSGYDDYIIQNNSKYGICSGEGKILVDCIYDSISHMRNSYEVCSESKKGIISTEGKTIIPCQYDKIEEDLDPSGGGIFGFIVYHNQKTGYYKHDGELIVDCKYDSIKKIDSFEDPYCIELNLNGKSAMFYHDKIVTDFIFESIGKTLWSAYTTNEGGYYYFHEVIINGKHGIINNEGDFILNSKYESIEFLDVCSINKEPFFKVETEGLIGIVTKNDEIIVPASYDDIIPMSYYCNFVDAYVVVIEGKKAILKNDNWGKKQKMITGFDFSNIQIQYSKEHRVLGYSVAKDGKIGFLDENGKQLISFMYDSIKAIENPNDSDSVLLYIVKQDKKAGVIDVNGDIVVPCKYDNCNYIDTDKNKFICYNDDVIGESGKKVLGSGTPCTALDIISKETYHLKTKSIYRAKDELKQIGL